MKCQGCGKDFEEKEIQVHHVHPRFMNNKKGEGIKLNLCEGCHNKIHLIIPSIYWDILTEEQKIESIRRVIGFTKSYGGLK